MSVLLHTAPRPGRLVSLAATIVAVFVAACGSDGGPSDPVPSSVVIAPHQGILRLGQQRTLAAAVLDQRGDTLPDTVAWAALDPAAATVNEDGLVTSVAVGNARIVATSGTLADTTVLSVTLVPIASIVLTVDHDSLGVEDSTGVTAVAHDSAGGILVGRSVAITSADPAVVTLLPSGWVRAAEYGVGRIVASGEGVADTVTIDVHLRFGKLYMGYAGACGLTSGGIPYCWGDNTWGQVGGGAGPDAGTPSMIPAPRRVPGGHRFVAMELAEYGAAACGLTGARVTWCWGSNGFGQLGTGSVGGESNVPVQVTGGHEFVSLESGYSSFCGVEVGGTLRCWGGRTYGSWGDSLAAGNATAPVVAAGGRHFSVFTMAWRQSCGISTEDGYVCWGQNRNGTFGAGDTASALVPRAINIGLTFTALRGSFDNMCGVAGNALYCWGFNVGGQVGDGTTTERRVPTPVSGGLSLQDSPRSLAPDCTVAADGKGYCWGVPFVETPTEVPLAGGWVSLAAGDSFRCGLGNDGIAYCFGANVKGRLGVGSIDQGLTLAAPTPVAGQ